MSATDVHTVRITHSTRGFLDFQKNHPAIAVVMIRAAVETGKTREDWLYCVYWDAEKQMAVELGHDRSAPAGALKAYFGENETGGYTAMLPEEY